MDIPKIIETEVRNRLKLRAKMLLSKALPLYKKEIEEIMDLQKKRWDLYLQTKKLEEQEEAMKKALQLKSNIYVPPRAYREPDFEYYESYKYLDIEGKVLRKLIKGKKITREAIKKYVREEIKI